MAGDLSRRIPVGATGAELGRLAEGLNRMLARIEELVGNLCHVSGDIAHDLRTPLGRLRQRLDACRVKPRSAAEYEAAIDGAISDSDAFGGGARARGRGAGTHFLMGTHEFLDALSHRSATLQSPHYLARHFFD